MAIASMDQLVAGLAGGQLLDTYEATMTCVAGRYQSLWTAGGHPAAGAAPGSTSGLVPTNATAGAIPFSNPGGSLVAYLASFSISSSSPETVMLYDRLVHSSGLSGTVATAQTVGTPSLTRYTSGVGVGCWIEIYTATGATAVTATVSYTNQAGTSGKSGTAAIPASAAAGNMFPVSLASGDTGVESVQSVTLSATTGTAGNFGVTLTYRLAQGFAVVAGLGQPQDYSLLGLPIVQNSACLFYQVMPSTTTTGTIVSTLGLAVG